MKTVAVDELENHLRNYLHDVRGGEIFLVTDRGRVVAELRQPSTDTLVSAEDRAIERWVAQGLLTPGLPQDARAYRSSPLPRAVPSADLLDAERGRE